MGKVISIIEENIPKKENDFPKLMRNNAGAIVLFYCNGGGTEVGNVYHNSDFIGFYATTWNMSDFYDFDGEVTLKNG